MIDLASAPVKQAQQASDQASQQNQTNITGLSSALGQLLSGIGPGVEKTYSDAADRQAAFAKGFSDAAQAAQGQRSADTSSFLQNIVHAPDSQVSQVQGQVNPAGTGDTLYGLRGYIPASTLNEEGAAYTANAKMLPSIAESQGLQQLSKEQATQRATDAKFAQELGSISAKAPEYARQLTNDAFNQAATRTRLGQSQARLDLQSSVDAFNEKYKTATYNLSVDRVNLSARKFAQQTLQSDRSYALSLASLGIRTWAEQRKTLADEYKLRNGGLSADKIQTYKGTAATIADQAFTGVSPSGKNDPLSLQDAVKAMREHGVPLSIATDALKQAGYVLPTPTQTRSFNQTTGVGVSPKAQDVVTFASGMLGTPYVWGGNQPGTALDCSGFVQQVYKRIGVSLPRTTYQQVKAGRPVQLNALQPGDAIFTIPGKSGPEHVGLYVGNNLVQVSPSSGDVNKLVPLDQYLKLGFVSARRYLKAK